MSVTFYPKRLLLAVLVLILFGATVSLATDLHRAAAAGALALLSVVAYVALEAGLTVNPALWWRDRNASEDRSRTTTP